MGIFDRSVSGKDEGSTPNNQSARSLNQTQVNGDAACRQIFNMDMSPKAGTAVTIRGKFPKKATDQLPTTTPHPAVIPDNTPTFKFSAKFNNCKAGYYVVRWHVNVKENFHIPNGLRFSVNVTYDAERDTTGSLDIVMPPEKLRTLEKGQWHDLELGELVVVQPYQSSDLSGKTQWATIEVALSNCERIGSKCSGLQVENVEIRPFIESDDQDHATPNPSTFPKHVVTGTATPKFTVDAMESPAFYRDTDANLPPILPITRLAWSKESNFLAALAVWKDTAYISVWDMKFLDLSNPQDTSNLHRHCTVANVKRDEGGDIDHLSIGLAISPKGDQIAVYQEPKIGQWADGSELEDKCEFEFCLLENPQAQPHSQVRDQTLVIAMSDASGTNGWKAGHPRKNDISSGSPHPLPVGVKRLDRKGNIPNSMLKNFIGYGAFLTETRDGDWELNNISSTAHNRVGTEGGNKAGKDPNTLFVACNGIYLDIFRIKPKYRGQPDPKWESIHNIRLTDLTPTISRRITCKMMMESISSNTFMWLEDGGLCCTIWDLHKGSNVSYIASTENARFRGRTFRGNSKMAISPDESIVALARDGTLVTYYAYTGVVIRERKFTDYKIEYVSFHGKSGEVFVITRKNTTLELCAWILDPLQLDSEIQAPKTHVPIPVIGKTVLAFFRERQLKNKGLICDSNGGSINCHFSYEPVDRSAIRNNMTIVKHNDPALQHFTDQYTLRTGIHQESFRDGDGSMYWVLRVEVVENEKPVFSFVPEPWMRVSTTAVREPVHLLCVYFLPGQRRFVVAGMQTLQIWSLPTKENADFSLAFIWSRPRSAKDPDWSYGRVFKSEPAGWYYHAIQNPKIYLNHATGDVEALVKPKEGSGTAGTDIVRIPGEHSSNTRSVFYNCARSIHLLSAAYAYSMHMKEKYPSNSRRSTFTYEEHAAAIAQFTRGHINRQMPSEDFYLPWPTESYDSIEELAARIQAQPNFQVPSTPVQSSPPIVVTASEGASIPKYPSLDSLRSRFNNQSAAQSSNKLYDLPNTSNIKLKDPSAAKHPVLDIIGDNSTKAIMCTTNFARAIFPDGLLDALDKLKSRIWSPVRDDESKDVAMLLTLLLDQHDLKEANHAFVEGLLDTDAGEWVPHGNMTLNPIRCAIRYRYESLLETLVDYCVKNAKKYHPAYMIPAVQCLNELSKQYPDILCDLFRRASYVPAPNSDYIASHAIMANLRFSDWITFFAHYFTLSLFKGRVMQHSKCPKINHYERPVFSLRSQLPYQSSGFFDFRSIESPMHKKRTKHFPEIQDSPQVTGDVTEAFSHKIYVVPFPKMSSYGIYQPWYKKYTTNRIKSAFTRLSGGSFFDSPAMQATLEFKWCKYGLLHWVMPFVISLMFFICMMIVTGLQIYYSTLKDYHGESPDDKYPPFPTGYEPTLPEKNPKQDDGDIQARYLRNWSRFFALTIVVGLILILLDLRRILISYKTIKSPYMIMRAAAYILSVVGCSIFMHYMHRPVLDPKYDNGPSQIWYMSYGILALYLNMLFELRVFRPFGVPVYIIMKIMWRVRWFFIILALFILSFTHALLHLLHTRSYDPCLGADGQPNTGACKDDYPDTFPKNFRMALTATTFFLAGRYEPIGNSLDSGSISLHFMMVVFYMFTALLITNILIAWMGHAFTQCKEEGKEAWHRQWSEVIADVELSFMSNSSLYNRNMFPDYIYYGASEKVAAQHESTYSNIASKSNLSLENRFVYENLEKKHEQTHGAQRQMMIHIKAMNDGQTRQIGDDPDVKNDYRKEDKHVNELQKRLDRTEEMLARVLNLLESGSARSPPFEQSSPKESSARAESPDQGPAETPASETSTVDNGRSAGFPSRGLSRHKSQHTDHHDYSIDRPYYPPLQDREDLSSHVHGAEEDHDFYPQARTSIDQAEGTSSSSGARKRLSAQNAANVVSALIKKGPV